MTSIKQFFASWEKLSYRFSPAFNLYKAMYSGVVEREVAMGNITHRDTVLNVGCGAIPFTAIHIANLTGAQIIAMDKDQDAVLKARHALKKYGLSNHIQVVGGDAFGGFPTPFTVALVALQVADKPTLLSKLQIEGGPGSKVIIRQPTDQYGETYGLIPHHLVPDAKVTHKMKTFKESFLFVTR